MAARKQIEIQRDDEAQQKWRVSLGEEVFKKLLSSSSSSSNSNIFHKVFGDQGSLFSPLLFGKFFDPSDAFPLWEFDSDVLLSNLKSSGRGTVDWFETNHEYGLKAELPGGQIQIHIERGNILEISGQLLMKQQQQQHTKTMECNWKSGNWWEHGFVRRLELPEDADCKRMEAHVSNDMMGLEIRIPKIDADPSAEGSGSKDSHHEMV